MVNSARGRPRGPSDARERLLFAAQRHLAAGDLSLCSLRSLAQEAGVSHTLVNYHFGSREGLIAASLALRVAPHQVIARAISADGVVHLDQLFRDLVAVWEHVETAPALHALAGRVLGHDAEATAAKAYLEHAVFEPLATALGQAHARRVAVVVVGTIITRYVVGLSAMVRLGPAETVAQMARMSR